MGMWAQEETLASFSNSDNEGWTISGSPSYSNSGGYQLVSSDMSITSPSINFSNYKNVNITITARKYGGPNTTQGKISVKQGSTELATYSPSSTTLTASNALAISPSDGTLTISCPGASSSKGCGISAIVIKGTPKGGNPDTTPDPDPTPAGGITYTLGSFSNIGDYSDVILVWTNSTASYGITNGNGTSTAPTAKKVTVTDSKISYSDNDIVWTIKNYDAENGTFEIWSKADGTKYLYATNTNNGVRVGTGVGKTFQIKDEYLYENGTKRYLGIYSDQDIRCYTSINSNISNQTIAVYYRETKSFDLKIGTSEWASMFLDFAAEVPEGATAYYASKVEDDIITLKPVKTGEILPANTGVIVNGSSCTFTESTETPATVTGNLFEGVTKATPCEARTVWVLNTASTAELGDPVLSLYTGTSLGANKAYLPASKVAGAKSLKLVVDDNEATGINSATTVKATGVAFNLAGQRVAPNAKGIVIVNGKKFINK